MDDQEYKVGRGRPPKETQFKKGQSGNPKGRPKRKPEVRCVAEILETELNRPVIVYENNVKYTISALQAIMRGVVVGALKGDRKMMLEVIKMRESKVEGLFVLKPTPDYHLVIPGDPENELPLEDKPS